MKVNKVKSPGFSRKTKIEHEGYKPELSEGAVSVPIFITTTYQFNSTEDGDKAFISALSGESLSNLIYSRVNHPNAEILENRLKNIEPRGVEAAVFCSGMAAIVTTILATNIPSRVIAYTNPLYGGTYHFLNGYLKNELGYEIVELSHKTNTACKQLARLGKRLGLLYIETPANPTLQMANIKKLCLAAKKASSSSTTVLDNTFMGIFQSGFKVSKNLDLVLYSGTKFIGGHSDVLNGAVICHEKTTDLMKKIKGLRIILGNILHPFECSQVISHLSTYELRMKQQAKNAKIIARRLYNLKSNKINKILYPDLLKKNTPEYRIYKSQCSGGSSIISIWLKADKEGTARFLNSLKQSGIIQLAVSLGGVESLASRPSTTTHSEMEPEVLNKLDITDNLVRFSVGIEEPGDLLRVIRRALKAI